MMTLEEIKTYLKIEHQEEDGLLLELLATSKELCFEILRKKSESSVLKTAILYSVTYLYEHREEASHKELKETLFHLLLGERKEVF